MAKSNTNTKRNLPLPTFAGGSPEVKGNDKPTLPNDVCDAAVEEWESTPDNRAFTLTRGVTAAVIVKRHEGKKVTPTLIREIVQAVVPQRDLEALEQHGQGEFRRRLITG